VIRALPPLVAGSTHMGMALSDDGRFCVANYFPGGQPLVKPCQAMNHEHEVVINEYEMIQMLDWK